MQFYFQKDYSELSPPTLRVHTLRVTLDILNLIIIIYDEFDVRQFYRII